jgi:hypothetical protein
MELLTEPEPGYPIYLFPSAQVLAQSHPIAKCFICAGKHEGSKHECTIESCSKRAEPFEHYAARCANCQGPHQATSKKCPERRASRQKRVRERTEIRSSPPMMETEMEQDDLPEAEHQAGATSPNGDPTQTLCRNRSLPRITGELRSLTESFAGATQLLSFTDPTPMSVDDDSAST